jgi:hypothetical protein
MQGVRPLTTADNVTVTVTVTVTAEPTPRRALIPRPLLLLSSVILLLPTASIIPIAT